MPLMVSLRFSKAVMSLQSSSGTGSITVASSSAEELEGAEAGISQELELFSGVFLYILEPIPSPGNREHD